MTDLTISEGWFKPDWSQECGNASEATVYALFGVASRLESLKVQKP